MWKDILNSIGGGTFDDTAWGLGGMGGVNSDWQSFFQQYIGIGGSNDFKDGGIFSSGGIFDISPGSIIGGVFGLGFDEIHNDASLNNNVTWGILHSRYVIRPRIRERQQRNMAIQDTINLSVKRLWELEKLTQDYLNTKQSDAVEIEVYQDIVNTLNDIGTLYQVNNQLADKSANLNYVKDRQNIIIVTRSARIVTKFMGFARVDGNGNLLNNDDRNEIITYLMKEFKDMRSILASTYKVLYVAANEEQFQNLIKSPK
jgi:hypothetical protein